MFPVAIDLGRVDLPLLGQVHLFLPTYGLLFALAVVLSGWWFIQRAKSLGLPDESVYNVAFYSMLAGLLGAKLALVATDWRYYVEHPVDLLGVLRAAGVLIVGVIAGILVFIAYARHRGLPALRLADAVAAPLALAQAIGRLGCFAAGCCWGAPAGPGNPLAVVFTNPLAHEQTGVPLGQPLLPTQLIQMANDLVLCLVLTWFWRRKPEPPGTVFWIYVLLYGMTRGIIEFWRGDAQRGLYFDGRISTSQLLAAAGIVFATIMLARGQRTLRQAALT